MTYPPLRPSTDFQWPEIAAVPIHECSAPLQILPAHPRLRSRPVYFEQGIAGATPHILLRAPLIERLLAALDTLPSTYGFEILDGWRSLAVQGALRESFRSRIEARHPEYSESQIQNTLDQFVANPHHPGMTPPHLTGGSVDLTLFDTANGIVLDMGTAFDEPSHRSHSCTLEHEAPSPAQQHHRILIHTMLGAGFTNLPTEWWHFDYGNQNWAFFSGCAGACFGAATCPQQDVT